MAGEAGALPLRDEGIAKAGNARIGGVVAIRSPAETEHFVREQYELYCKLVTALGARQ